jgi:glyoxylase-like metal-dependent hydrolase (beta-lactamase superfamily II)
VEHWICKTCGTQFPASATPPAGCPICLDPRQYVARTGQAWTTLAEMQRAGFHNVLKPQEPGLIGIGTEPQFAIGQRALLVQTPEGHILWDCITYFDEETAQKIERLGGIKAITISHPHFYSAMVAWADRFDAPIYLHESNRRWVMRPSPRVEFWSGESLKLAEAVSVVRLGGHFPGSTVLHWASGADGRGALLTADTIYVVEDRRWVSFMYSFPNRIPLPASAIQHIRDTIQPYHFDRLYSGWFDAIIPTDAKAAVLRSADRYINALAGIFPKEE